MALSTQQVRVIDPILTNIVQGYKNMELVGSELFPPVTVYQSGGQIIEFGKEHMKIFDSARAPGAATKRISIGYSGKPYALKQTSLEAIVPQEYLRDAKAVPGIDLAARSIYAVMNSLLLQREITQATLATNLASYGASNRVTLAGATKWSAATGTPLTDVDNAREIIRMQTGIYPNVMLMSALAFNAAKNNPNVIARLQYNANVSPDATTITAKMLEGLFNVDKIIVGKAIAFNDLNQVGDIWGNNVVLAYVPQSLIGIEQPSFGYTYTMANNPMVKMSYFDNNHESWIYGVHYEYAPVLAGMSSGYLIQNPA
ncbi:major capsid protein [Crenothrix polyspora]|uniref:Uncharacterized protein n=1 Tax=Crenothrix polyspora TaxID=360316 RepID=A0A1R4HIG2_9GAMM|nr:major capsid protein [Crenothrix polyspora]SJM96038.1 conserved hypothetical protein [Crenothrix polyspora]